MKPMDRWILGPACVALCVALALPAFDGLAAPLVPTETPAPDAASDEYLSDEDRPTGDTPDWVVGEMLCARPR